MPALYALLDPLWSRMPMPTRGRAREIRIGPLPALEMSRTFRGKPMMRVYSYAVGDTLVDTGLPGLGAQVLAFARARGARHAILTHHHEDHAGHAGPLAAAGLDVRATALTGRILEAPIPSPFYEHLAWGKPGPARPALLPDSVELLGDRVEVLPAPGHCVDQVVLWMPARGWLFAGDVFLHEQVRLFRRDEDFAATIATLERLSALPIEALFCAHRPRIDGGAAALRAKLQHLRDIEGRVRTQYARGASVRRIAADLRLPGSRGLQWLSMGDASTANLVHSILFGPRPRAELRRLGAV